MKNETITEITKCMTNPFSIFMLVVGVILGALGQNEIKMGIAAGFVEGIALWIVGSFISGIFDYDTTKDRS